ncbi:collagen-binding domain-containing protein [Sandaracinobacteroides hominis]|uniref:collagen-binding domain-containing protein n=1 Tax=Sandaracinobacteroides hominis TaxID=2780086 RepID=UPI0018F5009E|nr:collagen-binding domain-containing protein [Sandaracinobacteroides hominis]
MHVKILARILVGAAAMAIAIPSNATGSVVDAVKAMNEYNVIVFGDMSGGHDVEGKTFVGGSLSGSGIYGIGNPTYSQSLASSLPILTVVGNATSIGNINNGPDGTTGNQIGTPPALTIGGNFSGSLNPGNMIVNIGGNASFNAPSGSTVNVGGSFSGGNNGAVINQNLGAAYSVPLQNALVLQRDKLIADLTLFSTTLNGFSTTAGSGIDYSDGNNVKLTAVAGADGYAVLNVNASDFFDSNKVRAISYNFDPNLVTIVNIQGIGGDPAAAVNYNWGFNTIDGAFGSKTLYNDNVLFNFASGYDLNDTLTTDRQVQGSILAPFLKVANRTPIEGTLVTAIFNQGGEVHLENFDPNVPFGTEPPPVLPEPGTWAMLILGFGFIGATARRRRTTLARAAA